MHYLPIVVPRQCSCGPCRILLEQEELIDQGVLALIECLERYDPDRGARFETFAFMRVRGAMIDYIRSQDWVPHKQSEKFPEKVEEACSICPISR